MVRYSWKKNVGQLMESGGEDAEKVRATKDATKKLVKGGSLTDAASSSSNPAPDVKLEHVWVLPTKNTKEEMQALLQKARAMSNAYKRFKVQLDNPDIVKIQDCLNQLDTELLKRTLENTESFSEEECQKYVKNGQELIAEGKKSITLAEEKKKAYQSQLKGKST